MKFCLLFALSLLIHFPLSAQNEVFGVWKAIDDKDGEPTSHIEITDINGKANAKIIKLYDQPDDILCEKCKGDKKDKPVLGMEIMWGMKNNGAEWTGGKIMDPEDGNTYKCKIKLDDDGSLKVRGYIGLPILGRTQTWFRVE